MIFAYFHILLNHACLCLSRFQVPDSMFTLFRVMSGAQSDGESEALDSFLDLLEVFGSSCSHLFCKCW